MSGVSKCRQNETDTKIGSLEFDAEPSVITSGYTKEFSLTCRYRYTVNATIRNVVYMAIAKETAPGQLTSLAFISKRAGNTSNCSGMNGDDRGHFGKDNASSLILHFRGPVFERNETYACVVKGLGDVGDIFQAVGRVNVTVKDQDDPQPLNRDNLFYPPFAYSDAVYYLSRETAASCALAARYCRHIGGYLIEVDDADELKIAASLARFYKCRFVFIAGSDQEVEGHWIFPRTGQNVTFFNWDYKQPDDHVEEDCRIIQYQGRADRINDVDCVWNVNFMCEVKNVQL